MRFRAELQSYLVPTLIEASVDPDHPAQAQARKWVERWAGSKLPAKSALVALRQRLQQEAGTLVEPFSLTPAQIEVALVLARAFFRHSGPGERFRVVSNSSASLSGGLEFSADGGFQYRERLVYGLQTNKGESPYFYAPAYRPAALGACDLTRPTTNAWLSFSDRGMELRIAGAGRLLTRSSQSVIRLGPDRDVRKYGLELHTQERNLVLTATTAEALIRLEAACAEGLLVSLPDNTSAVVLRPLESDEPAVLDSLIFPSPVPDRWLEFPWARCRVPELDESWLPHEPRLFQALT